MLEQSQQYAHSTQKCVFRYTLLTYGQNFRAKSHEISKSNDHKKNEVSSFEHIYEYVLNVRV